MTPQVEATTTGHTAKPASANGSPAVPKTPAAPIAPAWQQADGWRKDPLPPWQQAPGWRKESVAATTADNISASASVNPPAPSGPHRFGATLPAPPDDSPPQAARTAAGQPPITRSRGAAQPASQPPSWAAFGEGPESSPEAVEDARRAWVKSKSLRAALIAGGCIGVLVAIAEIQRSSRGTGTAGYPPVATILDGALAFAVSALVWGLVTYAIATRINKRRLRQEPPNTAPLFNARELPPRVTNASSPSTPLPMASAAPPAPPPLSVAPSAPQASEPSVAPPSSKTTTAPQFKSTARRTATGNRGVDVAIGGLLVAFLVFVGVAAAATFSGSNRSSSAPTATSSVSKGVDPKTRWAAWFDTQWAEGAAANDASRRAQVCREYRADRMGTTREAANAMWSDISRTYPEVLGQGLTSSMIYDGFVRNLADTCG